MNSPAVAASTTSSSAPAISSGRLVGVLAFAGILASLMQTLVVPLIAQLPDILHTSATNASWVITVTLLTGAVFMPIAGRLGDRYGERRILLALMVPMIVGSVLCALTSSLAVMVVGRGLQGLSTAMVPLGISLLQRSLPAEKVGSAVALMSSSLGIGGALGLPIAAAVAQYASWRILFWAVAAAGVIVALVVWRAIPATAPADSTGGFDFVGAVLLGGGLVGLLLAISKGTDWGWGSATVIALLAATVVLALVFGWWELRRRDALVDLRVAARPRVLVTNFASLVVGFAMYAQSLIIPQIMQLPTSTGYGLGQSMLAMGLWMAPSGIAMMAVAPLGARITTARGPKFTLTVGACVMALGYGTGALLMGAPWGLMIGAIISSAGTGFAYGSMPAIVMSGVPRSQTASANSVNSLMRSVGTTVSAAVIGVVLAHMVVPMGESAITSQAGFRTGLLIGCGVALLAALLAAVIPPAPAVVAAEGEPVGEPSAAVPEELDAALTAVGPDPAAEGR